MDNVQKEFVLEIPIKGNISCNDIIFGLRRFAASCGTMYFRESDCEMLKTLTNEEWCYVRCYCNNICDGNLIVNVERDEQHWTLCPTNIAWNFNRSMWLVTRKQAISNVTVRVLYVFRNQKVKNLIKSILLTESYATYNKALTYTLKIQQMCFYLCVCVLSHVFLETPQT